MLLPSQMISPMFKKLPVIAGMLFCWAFVAAVFTTGITSPWLVTLSMAIGIAALILILLAPNIRHGWQIPKTPLFILVGLFWLWLVISLSWSSVPFISTYFTILWSILPALFMALVLAHHRLAIAPVLLYGTIGVCGLFAVWALIQFFFLYETYGTRIHHPMIDPNNLSALFNIGIFPALAVFLVSGNPVIRRIALALALLFFAGLLVTQSRGAMLAFIIAFAILMAVLVGKTGLLQEKRRIFMLVIAALALTITLHNYHPILTGQKHFQSNLTKIDMVGTGSFTSRIHLLESTYDMATDNLWTGTGMATFFLHYPSYRNPAERSSGGMFTHSDTLQLWAETGLPSFLLFYAILIAALWRTIAALKAAGQDKDKKSAVIAPFCAMLAVTGHAHVTYLFYTPAVLIPFAVMFGVWYLATEQALGDDSKRLSFIPSGAKKWSAALIAGGIPVIGCVWILRAAIATAITQNAALLVNQDRMNETAPYIAAAAAVAPGSFGDHYEFEAQIRMIHLQRHAKDMEKEDIRIMFEEALAYSAKAQEKNPVNTSLWHLDATLYLTVHEGLIEDGLERGVVILERVLDFNPLSIGSRFLLSRLYRLQERHDDALALLHDAEQWRRYNRQEDVWLYQMIADIYDFKGDSRKQEEYLERVKEVQRNIVRRQQR